MDRFLEMLTRYSSIKNPGYIGFGGIGPVAITVHTSAFPLLHDSAGRPFFYPFSPLSVMCLLEYGMWCRVHDWEKISDILCVPKKHVIEIEKACLMVHRHDPALRREILLELGISDERIALEVRPSEEGGPFLRREDRHILYQSAVPVSVIKEKAQR